jgi:hypothetical protein
MKSAPFSILFPLLASGLLGIIYALDGAGLFIYLGYGPAFLVSALLILGATIFFGRERRGRGQSLLLLAVSVALMAGVFIITRLPTSPRKSFFLSFSRIKPGMATAEAEKLLKPYGEIGFDRQEKAMTLRFRSNPGTVDVVHLKVTSDLTTISEAEFSPD